MRRGARAAVGLGGTQTTKEGTMKRLLRVAPVRTGVAFVTIAATVFGLTFGLALASGHHAATKAPLPCQSGGAGCIDIGFTRAWYDGRTVKLEFSHDYFCAEPPHSSATSGCEAGKPAQVAPPSGPVVSEIYELIPIGFHPPRRTLHCGNRCIDHPRTIDVSRLFNGNGGGNAPLPARAFVIEDEEHFQSTWWPVVLVGVKNLHAWNRIVNAKDIEAVDACQENGGCFPEVDTNAFVVFQVLGPGMGVQGPD